MRSSGPHPHRAVEAEHDALDAVVIDVRGLRQAGRAARIDVEALVLDGELRQVGCRGSARPASASISVSSRSKPSGAPPWHQKCGAAVRCGSAVRKPSMSAASTMTCFGLTMLTQWASAAPVRLVLSSAMTPPARAMPSQTARYSGPVRHHQRDDVALGDAIRHRPARILVAAPVVFAGRSCARDRR